MTIRIKHTAYVDQPCSRCGSKLYVSREWKEKIPTFSGKFTEVACKQLACSNVACQEAFEKTQKDEAAKRELAQKKKEEHEAIRKEKALHAANISRASQKTRP